MFLKCSRVQTSVLARVWTRLIKILVADVSAA